MVQENNVTYKTPVFLLGIIIIFPNVLGRDDVFMNTCESLFYVS